MSLAPKFNVLQCGLSVSHMKSPLQWFSHSIAFTTINVLRCHSSSIVKKKSSEQQGLVSLTYKGGEVIRVQGRGGEGYGLRVGFGFRLGPMLRSHMQFFALPSVAEHCTPTRQLPLVSGKGGRP